LTGIPITEYAIIIIRPAKVVGDILPYPTVEQTVKVLALEASIHAESPMLNGGLYLWNQIFEEIQVGLDHAEDKKRRNPRTCDGF